MVNQIDIPWTQKWKKAEEHSLLCLTLFGFGVGLVFFYLFFCLETEDREKIYTKEIVNFHQMKICFVVSLC